MCPDALDRDDEAMHPLQYTDLAREHREDLMAAAGRRRLVRLVRSHNRPENA
jgi:hypothetical protein